MDSKNTQFYRESDNVYLNATISHPSAIYPVGTTGPSMGVEPILAEYQVNNDTPFLDDASQYYASIIRFDIPLNVVPLYIMPIIPNQIDPNLTPLIIGILKDNVHYSTNLLYLPDLTNETPPEQDKPTQVITPYYYVYNYGKLIRMVNQALFNACYNAGIATVIDKTNVPYFFLDPVTELISLVIPDAFRSQISPPLGFLEIYINTPLFNYLNGFQFSFIGNNKPFGREWVFILESTYTNNAYYLAGQPTNVPPSYWIYTQEYSTLESWTSVRKILILSSKLPVVAESISLPNSGSSTSRVPILADFVPQIDASGDSRGIAYYLPSAQYRLVDMISTTYLQSFDLKFYWQDSLSNLYPLYISLYQQINIKLAFLRKTLYKSQLLNKI